MKTDTIKIESSRKAHSDSSGAPFCQDGELHTYNNTAVTGDDFLHLFYGQAAFRQASDHEGISNALGEILPGFLR
jgi:hypothetical protein